MVAGVSWNRDSRNLVDRQLTIDISKTHERFCVTVGKICAKRFRHWERRPLTSKLISTHIFLRLISTWSLFFSQN